MLSGGTTHANFIVFSLSGFDLLNYALENMTQRYEKISFDIFWKGMLYLVANYLCVQKCILVYINHNIMKRNLKQ